MAEVDSTTKAEWTPYRREGCEVVYVDAFTADPEAVCTCPTEEAADVTVSRMNGAYNRGFGAGREADVERMRREGFELKCISENADISAWPSDGAVELKTLGRVAFEVDHGDPSVGMGGWSGWTLMPADGVVVVTAGDAAEWAASAKALARVADLSDDLVEAVWALGATEEHQNCTEASIRECRKELSAKAHALHAALAQLEMPVDGSPSAGVPRGRANGSGADAEPEARSGQVGNLPHADAPASADPALQRDRAAECTCPTKFFPGTKHQVSCALYGSEGQ